MYYIRTKNMYLLSNIRGKLEFIRIRSFFQKQTYPKNYILHGGWDKIIFYILNYIGDQYTLSCQHYQIILTLRSFSPWRCKIASSPWFKEAICKIGRDISISFLYYFILTVTNIQCRRPPHHVISVLVPFAMNILI